MCPGTVGSSWSLYDTRVTLVKMLCNFLKIHCHDIKCITTVQYQQYICSTLLNVSGGKLGVFSLEEYMNGMVYLKIKPYSLIRVKTPRISILFLTIIQLCRM